MQVIKHLATGIILLITASCIEPFQPDLKETQDLLVINGMITDQPGEHVLEISRSAPFNDPVFIPVTGCVVQVADDKGTIVDYSEKKSGVYSAYLDASFLGTGKAYKLYVFTPDNKEYQSEYDSMLACPPIDKISYEIESRETENPGITYYGVQFYVDVKSSGDDAVNFLWNLEETFEYNSSYLIHYIWTGYELVDFRPRDSLYTCYKTQPINELHTASARYLSSNDLYKYPLNYVSNQSTKLLVKYSLLARQYSLSDNAFLYWDKLKSQLTGRGGFYETQPYSSDGNIFNVNDPDEKVLGFFYTSQVKKKRIMIDRSFNFPIWRSICRLDTAFTEIDIPVGSYAISLNEMSSSGPPYGYTSPECFDCRLLGGTLEPPFYWNKYE